VQKSLPPCWKRAATPIGGPRSVPRTKSPLAAVSASGYSDDQSMAVLDRLLFELTAHIATGFPDSALFTLDGPS
jgi:hypothetical protein